MFLDLKKIRKDIYETLHEPNMGIATMSEKYICPVINPNNVNFQFRYNDVSTLTFDVSDNYQIESIESKSENDTQSEGEEIIKNPSFVELTGMRIINVEDIGKFILINPQREDVTGYSIKHCTAYSLEYEFNFKKLAPLNDTFMFHDPFSSRTNTITNLIREKAPGWRFAYIDRDVCSRHRTLDTSLENLYSLMMNTIQTSYECLFIFDTKDRSIYVYDARKQANISEIYLSHENLIKLSQINELNEEVVTSLKVYGAEDLSIESVNPLGTDTLLNLDYFVEIGDIPSPIREKWILWRNNYNICAPIYASLFDVYYMESSICVSHEAALNDLMGQIGVLDQTIDTMRLAGDTKSDPYQRAMSDKDKLEKAIEDKKQDIKLHTDSKNDIFNQMKKMSEACDLKNVFTIEQLEILNTFFKEDSIQDSTFVLSNMENPLLNDPGSYVYSDEGNFPAQLLFKECSLTELDVSEGISQKEIERLEGTPQEISKIVNVINKVEKYLDQTIYHISLGKFEMKKNMVGVNQNKTKDFIKNKLISGTITNSTVSLIGLNNSEINTDIDITVVLNITAGVIGDIWAKDPVTRKFGNGKFVLTGKLPIEHYSKIKENPETNLFNFLFTYIHHVTALFMPKSSSHQQQETIRELFEYGETTLKTLSYPTYEFTVDVANFLHDDNYWPFHEAFAMGAAVQLDLPYKIIKHPILIGIDVNFSDFTSFNLIFSNKYRSNSPEYLLSELIGETTSTAANLDSSKFSYARFSRINAEETINKLYNEALDLAKRSIINSNDVGFKIDNRGIHLKANSNNPCEMRLVNNKIVMTDNAWKTVKLAIGEIEYIDHVTDRKRHAMGIVADNIIGNLIVGESLKIESIGRDPITNREQSVLFKADNNGVYLGNSTLSFESTSDLNSRGNKLLIDPRYGIAGGNPEMFTYNNMGMPNPSFLDEKGKISFDEDGYMPKNTFFFLDVKNGKGYFKGNIYADNGYFKGKISAGSIQPLSVSMDKLSTDVRHNIQSSFSTSNHAMALAADTAGTLSAMPKIGISKLNSNAEASGGNRMTFAAGDTVPSPTPSMAGKSKAVNKDDCDIWFDTDKNIIAVKNTDNDWIELNNGDTSKEVISDVESIDSKTDKISTMYSSLVKPYSLFSKVANGLVETIVKLASKGDVESDTNKSSVFINKFNSGKGWELGKLDNYFEDSSGYGGSYTKLGSTSIIGGEISAKVYNSITDITDTVLATGAGKTYINELILGKKYYTDLFISDVVECRYYPNLDMCTIRGEISYQDNIDLIIPPLKIANDKVKNILPKNGQYFNCSIVSGEEYSWLPLCYQEDKLAFKLCNKNHIKNGDKVIIDISWNCDGSMESLLPQFKQEFTHNNTDEKEK